MSRLGIAILIASDTRAAGTACDEAGPALEELLRDHGHEVVEVMVVPDDRSQLAEAIVTLASLDGVDTVLTSGGTGIGPRDVTPEATRDACEIEIPGIGELIRSTGAAQTPMSWLSRATAGRCGPALVVNLPGSVRGAVSSCELVLPLLVHARHVVAGGGHDAPVRR